PPCFCVCRGNRGVTGEWLASRRNKGVRERESEEETKDECVVNSEIAQAQLPLSITTKAYHIIYRLSTIIYRVLVSKLVRGEGKKTQDPPSQTEDGAPRV